MNVLIVDDQKNVIDGIMLGIPWEKLGIEKVYQALSAESAKKIIRQHPVRIMICDIEMPQESGIDLLKWVRENQYATECIFLTAHAKFEYANLAIKLQTFDYILQPVEYSVLEDCIKRAMDKLSREEKKKSSNQYYWAVQLKNILVGNDSEWEAYLEDDSVKSMTITRRTMYLPFLVSVVRRRSLLESEEADRVVSCTDLERIASEVFRFEKGKNYVFRMRNSRFLFLFYQEDGMELLLKDLKEKTGQFMEQCREKLGIALACYMDTFGTIEKLSFLYQKINRLAEENAGMYAGLYYPGKPEGKRSFETDVMQWNRISMLLRNGLYEVVYSEMKKYLERLLNGQKISYSSLNEFRQDFWKALYRSAEGSAQGYDINLEADDDSFVHACESVENMLKYVEKVLKARQRKTPAKDEKRSVTEEAKRYIAEHIGQNMTRNEIAEAVFITPEYLSKIFRKEAGIGLVDYINQQKMETAKLYLLNTDQPVSTIAVNLGYTNFSYFSKLFRKYFKCSPNEVRSRKGFRMPQK